MSLKDYSREQMINMSMLELASKILKEEKKALDFHELYKRVTEFKGFSEKEKEEYIAQFYTDLNVDGRFTTLGSNIWGLKRWYPIEQADEEVHAPKKRKKKKQTKKKRVEEEEPEVEDEFVADDALKDNLDDDDLGDDLDNKLDEDIDELDEFDDDLEDEEIDEEFDDNDEEESKDEEEK